MASSREDQKNSIINLSKQIAELDLNQAKHPGLLQALIDKLYETMESIQEAKDAGLINLLGKTVWHFQVRLRDLQRELQTEEKTKNQNSENNQVLAELEGASSRAINVLRILSETLIDADEEERVLKEADGRGVDKDITSRDPDFDKSSEEVRNKILEYLELLATAKKATGNKMVLRKALGSEGKKLFTARSPVKTMRDLGRVVTGIQDAFADFVRGVDIDNGEEKPGTKIKIEKKFLRGADGTSVKIRNQYKAKDEAFFEEIAAKVARKRPGLD